MKILFSNKHKVLKDSGGDGILTQFSSFYSATKPRERQCCGDFGGEAVALPS